MLNEMGSQAQGDLMEQEIQSPFAIFRLLNVYFIQLNKSQYGYCHNNEKIYISHYTIIIQANAWVNQNCNQKLHNRQTVAKRKQERRQRPRGHDGQTEPKINTERKAGKGPLKTKGKKWTN